MYYKFYGGVHPETFKAQTSDKPIKRVFIPKKTVIPLSQHVGSPAEPVVTTGASVKVGDLIAKATGFISSAIHAPISGKVTKMSHTVTPTLARASAITIEAGDEDQEFKPSARRDVESISGGELIDIIKDAGIVGLGGAAFPTHVKLTPPKGKSIDSVILNGAECEPFLTCDHRLMLERSKEILKGLDIIMRILGARKAYIAIEDNKLSAIYAMEKAVIGDKGLGIGDWVKIIPLKTKYPQGAEKQVIKSVLNRTVPAGGLPMDVGCVVQNIGTVFAIYEAVYFGKPLIERVITITGDVVKEPMNIWVRIGTSLSDLESAFGGFTGTPRKIIVGGPMMGMSQYTKDVPVTKGVSGAVFLSGAWLDDSPESVCIRCGRCVEICPVGLVPTSLMYRVKKENFNEAKSMGITNCYECGACAYICPAKIPLLDYMKYGKAKV